MNDPYNAKEVDIPSREEVAHTSSPNGQGEVEVPGRNHDHVLDHTEEHVEVAVCNHSLVLVGAAPDEGDNLCDSRVHALHEKEGNNHDHEVEGDTLPPSPLLLEVDTLHDSQGGPCNQQPDNLFGRLAL